MNLFKRLYESIKWKPAKPFRELWLEPPIYYTNEHGQRIPIYTPQAKPESVRKDVSIAMDDKEQPFIRDKTVETYTPHDSEEREETSEHLIPRVYSLPSEPLYIEEEIIIPPNYPNTFIDGLQEIDLKRFRK